MSGDKYPLISIITPCYNSQRYIEETIASVLDQTYKNWEMIIVDDQSSDNTIEIIKLFAARDKRIRAVMLDQNKGPALARNEALRIAKGRYITFLDSDDIWLPDRLAVQLEYMMSSDIAFSFAEYRRISEHNERCGQLIKIPSAVTYNQLLKHNVICGFTVMIDRHKTGNISQLNTKHEDYILWLEILKRGHIAKGLHRDVGRYRIVAGSVSRNKLKSALARWRIYREIEKINFFKSCWYFMHYAVKSLWKHMQAYA
jgi:teichuronic acid biosynthesis glycosyltransferase TuaG